MGNIIVPVDHNLCATLKIGSDAFPFMLFHDDLDNFVRGFVNWHKQKEIEISFITEGSVRVCLLSEEHTLYAGDLFIILPDTLHSIQPVDCEPARYFTFIFESCLLTGHIGSFFEQTWYSPVVTSNDGYHSISGSSSAPFRDKIREHLFYVYEISEDADAGRRLDIQRHLQDIWLLLFDHVFTSTDISKRKHEENRILSMLNYLRTHYAEKFSLKNIAEYHHISKGECCRYFKKMMGMTITEFLMDYRLSKAAQRLILTQMRITDIAHECGFNSASNFSEEFRKKTGKTPTEYRSCAADDGKTKKNATSKV